MDSSRAEACSGLAPCREGSWARCSFSTLDRLAGFGASRGSTYGNLEINQFLRKRRHLVVEAEAVFTDGLRGEDEIALALLCVLHDDLLARSDDGVIDIERAAGLDLTRDC